MKCINCGTDSKLKERTANQGRCKNCNHRFAFEPTSMISVKFTDPFFKKILADISANNTLFFSQKQLFYFLNKRLRRKTSSGWTALGCFSIFLIIILGSTGIGWFIGIPLFILACVKGSAARENSPKVRRRFARTLQIFGGVITGLSIISLWVSPTEFIFFLFILGVLSGMLSIYLGTRQLWRKSHIPQTFLFAQSQAQQWVNRWILINGSLAKMLPTPSEASTPTQVNPDITAYSFDRLVVCDNASVAQLLIANNFHFENNCAVLSITGYPQSIFSTVLEMLRRNPELTIYALHDASPSGVSLVHQLRTSPNWFPNSNQTIIDLGLLPRQVLSSQSFFVQNSQESANQVKQLPADIRQTLSPEELQWLELGNFVELESFTPQKLLEVVTQGISKSRYPGGEGLVAIDDSGSSNTTIYAFSGDSFG